jgi:hypothetical protein
VHRLHVLAVVADRGSFSGAAEALFLTQPAVFRQIAALERERRAAGRAASPWRAPHPRRRGGAGARQGRPGPAGDGRDPAQGAGRPRGRPPSAGGVRQRQHLAAAPWLPRPGSRARIPIVSARWRISSRLPASNRGSGSTATTGPASRRWSPAGWASCSSPAWPCPAPRDDIVLRPLSPPLPARRVLAALADRAHSRS